MDQLLQESVGEPKSVESPPSRHPIASVFFAHSVFFPAGSLLSPHSVVYLLPYLSSLDINHQFNHHVFMFLILLTHPRLILQQVFITV